MLRDVEWSENRAYRTGSDWEPIQFYLDVLNESLSFDLLLGYFSSAAINVLSLGFAKFLSTGGTLRMIINNVLSAQDKEVFSKVSEGYIYQIPFDLTNFAELKCRLDDYDLHFFQCLGWLIQNNRIEIKIIRPLGKKGISHYKSGVFFDGNDKVGFSGSCNFTAFGLLENLEEIDAFLSWENGRSNKWLNSRTNDFEEIFNEKADFVEYLNIDQVKTAIVDNFGDKDIDELLVQEKELLERKKEFLTNKRTKKVIDATINKIQISLETPRFPYPQGAREYQNEAFLKWVQNEKKGIFSMATGTGKTLTSLNCLLNLYREKHVYHAIILVPTIALLDQWKKECLKFNYSNVICVSSKEDWNSSISFFNTASKFIDASFIVIVTYASFQKDKFQSHFKLLPLDTLLIADEVHNMGSPSMLKLLDKIHTPIRIGLSATPSRKYDMVGNESIERFFNDKPPYVYNYSMKMALDSNWLCKYSYYPHIVYLIEEELDKYIGYSKQLLRYFDAKTKGYKNCKEVEFLLLARKRIIHKAKNKKATFKKILETEFNNRGNLNYTLIYVPEGLEVNYDVADESIDSSDEISLINEYTKTVSQTDSTIMVKQYTSNTKNREVVIKDFENGLIHVLTSMKCLDEGVDVPRSELAIFCASTGNPRQFIQRRGRVLRIHKNKIHAVIHDLVVVPMIADNESSYEMERNLVKKELERVVDFSELSMNKIDTYNELQSVLGYYDINLNDFTQDNDN
jgi:superfamily II DNA or RNA helicase